MRPAAARTRSASRPRRRGWKTSGSMSAPTTRAGSRSRAYGRPSISAVPDVGRVRPNRILSVVDLPAPLAPTKPVMEPASREKLRSSTAGTAPYRLLIRSTVMLAMGEAPFVGGDASTSILVAGAPFGVRRTDALRLLLSTPFVLLEEYADVSPRGRTRLAVMGDDRPVVGVPDGRKRHANVPRAALLPVACGLLQSISVGTGVPDRSPGTTAAASLLGLASGLTLFGRARAPYSVLAATVVGYLAQVALGGPALPVAVCVMVFVVAGGHRAGRHQPVHPPTWTGVALLAGVVGVIAPLFATGFRTEAAVYGLLCTLAAAGGLLMALKAGRDEQRRTELVMAERLRIARDLHDVVGHGLGAITVQAGAARMAVGAGALEDATRSLLDIEAAGRGVLQEVRWLVTLLREDEEHPALLDVPDLVGNARRSGLDVSLDVEGDLDDVPAGCGEVAYRVVQEALTNVLRHAQRKEAAVSIKVADMLDLQVLDPGVPVGPAPDGVEGNGLRGMRERATAVGGVLSTGRRPDGRWSVHLELPLGR